MCRYNSSSRFKKGPAGFCVLAWRGRERHQWRFEAENGEAGSLDTSSFPGLHGKW